MVEMTGVSTIADVRHRSQFVKWKVQLDERTVRSGESPTSEAARHSAVWAVDKALAPKMVKLQPQADTLCRRGFPRFPGKKAPSHWEIRPRSAASKCVTLVLSFQQMPYFSAQRLELGPYTDF
jgi:hypothetical protein